MSFLKRILSFKDKEKTERFARLTTLTKIIFSCRDNKKEIPAVNISFSGIGLDAHYTDPEWKMRQDIHGDLILDEHTFSLILSVRHISPLIIGCKFTGLADVLKEPIEKYLQYELAGLMMRKVSTQFLNQDPRGEAMWFTDGKANELYAVTKDSELILCHLAFFGTYFEILPNKKIRMGFIQQHQKEKAAYKGSDLVRFVDKVDNRLLAVAQRFLNNIVGLPDEVKSQIENSILAAI
ncbi:MAG: hypothetical protein A4S09_00960 [Proteobacteria bacterium SG_bin7]|nr:MAG: hypothetical protein A4S09_00960 [Proteobacteria bacterium SG_bin7]